MDINLRTIHTTIDSALKSLQNKQLLHFDKNFLDDFYQRSCIYFLTIKKDKTTRDIVYIGQTNCLAKRLFDHKVDEKKEFDSFSYYFVSNKILDEVEEILISVFQPKFNVNKRSSWLNKKIAEAIGENANITKLKYNTGNFQLTLQEAIDIVESGNFQLYMLKHKIINI
jgi:hypothetical protein